MTIAASGRPTSAGSLQPLLLIGLLFFVFGFITWLNGALIPFLQLVCQLSEFEALLVAFSFYIAYVVMALPMSALLARLGYQRSMATGLGLIGLGCALFIPAALSAEFGLFLLAQFVVGAGLTLLQTASNPYLVLLGPAESAAARISLMGILNKSAGVLAPLVFFALVIAGLPPVTQQSLAALPPAEQQAQLSMLAGQLVLPYAGIALAMGLLALFLRQVHLPALPDAVPVRAVTTAEVLQVRHLRLGVLTLFCYVGVEVIAGDTIGLYGQALGLPNAMSLASYTLFFMVVGYVLGLLLVPRWLSQARALQVSAALGLLLTLAIVLLDRESQVLAAVLWGWTGLPLMPDPLTCVALLGLANAMVWPTVWPLALQGLGDKTPKAAALLIMGIAGGAVLPLLYGALADLRGHQQAYLMLLPCYAFILYYALTGHKPVERQAG